jgi:predicted CXXCH cytochrome family protein
MLAGVREGFSVPDGFVWRDHPIGVEYPSNRREYRQESFAVANGIRLPEGRVECVSCHDPHNEAGHGHLLSMSNRRSALCLTCHIK